MDHKTLTAHLRALDIIIDWRTTPKNSEDAVLLQKLTVAFAAVRQEEQERITNDVMNVIGGIAISHRWFPLQAVLDAIRGPLEPPREEGG